MSNLLNKRVKFNDEAPIFCPRNLKGTVIEYKGASVRVVWDGDVQSVEYDWNLEEIEDE